MNRSMPGLPVHHQPRSPPKPMSIESVMPTQPSHPLLSPSLPALNLSQHQGLFQWVSSLHQVAEVLELQLQHQSPHTRKVLGLKPLRNIFCGFLGGSDSKESAYHAGDLGSVSGLGRSPGGGHGNPHQYSCLDNPHGQRSLVGYNPCGCRVGQVSCKSVGLNN